MSRNREDTKITKNTNFFFKNASSCTFVVFVSSGSGRFTMVDDLDETIEESFPASDPPANTPETGIGVNGDHEMPPESPPECESGAEN